MESKALEQIDKRIELLEKLYVALDRKLWVIIVLVLGILLSNIAGKIS